MKKIILLVFLVWFLLPGWVPGRGGAYNTISGLIWCRSYDDCVHEVGHKLDDLSGWTSATEVYKTAIGSTVWNEKETYAEVFYFYYINGYEMPEHLAIFYDWELADKLMEKYNAN